MMQIKPSSRASNVALITCKSLQPNNINNITTIKLLSYLVKYYNIVIIELTFGVNHAQGFVVVVIVVAILFIYVYYNF